VTFNLQNFSGGLAVSILFVVLKISNLVASKFVFLSSAVFLVKNQHVFISPDPILGAIRLERLHRVSNYVGASETTVKNTSS